MKAVVGLGNPGVFYQGTRHNFGFIALDYLADILGVRIAEDRGFYLAAETRMEGEEVVLVKPVTFMNLSGRAVADVLADYPISTEDLIVLHDDVDIELGRVRIKVNGGAGGHKGVLSVIEEIGTEDFTRIRLGLRGRRIKGEDLSSFVLSPFAPEELSLVEQALPKVKEAVELIISCGVAKAMSIFNRRDKGGRDA
ncbi:MAG: aminoacyl-tRNA hydrolase [Acidobacteria bacterium]|nr:aminoacyl-tRNA hydrolase [Acidobacteriota bacterium]